MSDHLIRQLSTAPVVPLIQANEPPVALDTANALAAGGLSIVEVVLRTEEALACLEHLARQAPEVTVGAGTVLTAEQAQRAIDVGAMFIVSPGLDEDVVRVAEAGGLPVFPGVATATELQRAWNMGLRAVKFFPAAQLGGIATLTALSSVFRGMRFMPTGGVSANNLADYLALPSVLACGGSWLTPSRDVEAGRYDAITQLAEEAVAIARASGSADNG